MKTSCLLPNAAGQTQGLLLERKSFFPDVPQMPFTVRCVTTVHELVDFCYKLDEQKWFSFDTETTNINPRRAKLVGMSFCWEPSEAWYIPVQCPSDETCLPTDVVLNGIGYFLENGEIKKLGQNLKYDQIVLRNHGIHLQGVSFDTLIASYLLDAGSRRHNLDILAKKYLSHTTIKLSELIGTGKNQLSTKDVPLECMAAYAAEDAWVVTQIAPMLYAEAERQNLTKLLDHVEIPLVSVLADMEYNGIKVDLEKSNALQRDFESRIAKSLDSIQEQAGDGFNPNSSAQLREELFERLLLPATKNTKGGEYSTDKSVLNELAKQHDLPKAITEYRELTKLNGTYVSSLPGIVFPATGRIHASFNQAVTATGRLSSSDPNLQNIPARTEDGKKIRKLFVAEKDHVLVSADYSQIELRILAHYSSDPRLQEAFHSGEDIHAAVAAQVANVNLDQVTDSMRKAAKTINFGIIYGQGAKKLAESLGITKAQAEQFIAEYFKTYPRVRSFKQAVIGSCRRNGYVSTILGRRRYIPAINDPDGPDRWEAERMAVNTSVQGSAADVLKLAMLEIFSKIESKVLDARMLLQIHDELVFEVPELSADSACIAIKQLMENAVPLSVPLIVDTETGKSWGDMKIWGPVCETN